jgi:hypothetical protein
MLSRVYFWLGIVLLFVALIFFAWRAADNRPSIRPDRVPHSTVVPSR